MFGSIFTGLSGMNAFASGLRQISNNITNVNSTGFKSTGLIFSGLFAGNSQRSERSGQGVTLTEGRLDFSQGELRQSDRDLDLAIDGGGFLVLLKDAEQFFARTGSFEINPAGDIVLAGTDYKLMVIDESGVPQPISIASHRTNPPAPTTKITFSENLSSTATTATILSGIKIYDALGASVNWQVRLERPANAPAGEWSVTVTDAAGAEVGKKTLKFINGIVDPTTSQLSFADSAGRSIMLDFSRNVTSFSAGDVSTLRIASNDGYGSGDIATVRVTEQGVLEIAYTNEQKKTLGAVAIADIASTDALKQLSGGLFELNDNVAREYLTSAHEKVGRVVSRRLEASNVDLSQQFGDLILVQRGFQASSQVVSVSNDMIQQLFGMRGQG